MKRNTLRMFVALFPPPDVQSAISASVQTLSSGGGMPPHRLIDPAQVHMTLAFIGDVHPKDLRSVQESVDRSASGLPPFNLHVERFITIPTPTDGGPPRLVAAATDSPPTLLELQRRLAIRLTKPKANGRRERFLPHLTVVRYVHGQTSGAIDRLVGGGAVEGKMFHVEHCLLMESFLTREGSVYREISRARLDG